MQVLITRRNSGRSKVFQFTRAQIAMVGALILALLLFASGAVYHFLFLTAAREGWPVVSQVVRLVVRDETAQRDRFLRENLDMLAQRVGEMQAKLVTLDAMGQRVSGLAGVKPADLKGLSRPAPAASEPGGQGGVYLPMDHPTLDQLQAMLAVLDETADRSADVFTLAESRLTEARLQTLMIPSTKPVDGYVGSGFGFRSDPFTGRPALHTGLDFPAQVGTMIHAAAGGVVVSADPHSQYGNLLEIDHGNGLITRYAHTSKFLVRLGDIVRRGQPVAEVGTTGRSTGPHLHFEVLVGGVPQDPARFLAGASAQGKLASGER
jgi:murein DD-endopeptidase MepM/ murein hydrolase activator NlpD